MNATINASDADVDLLRACALDKRAPLTVLSCHAPRGAKPANTHPAGLA
jgi:hypothetical protein